MKYLKERLVVVCIFTLILLVGIKYCNDKNGYYLDEVYTYILSNSEYAPWITDFREGNITNTVISQQELFDIVTVDENDNFNFGSVYFNQTKDVHPPLYYFFIHAISSIFTNSFSKWIGLGFNLTVYAATLFVLYQIINRFFGTREQAVLITVIYGLSNIGLSTLMFIRMYMLLTFFTLLLTYFILSHMQSPQPKLYVAIAITIFCGMLTQYYFVIYAFLVCFSYDIYLLVCKKYKELLTFSVSALSGVISMMLLFPHFITQLSLQETVSMDKTVRNAQAVDKWLSRIVRMSSEVEKDIHIVTFIFVLLVVGMVIVSIKRKVIFRKYMKLLVVIVPAFVAYLVICIIAPYVTNRYVYHLVPVMLLVIAFLLCIQPEIVKHKMFNYCAIGIVVLISVHFLRDVKPDYVYDHSEFNYEIAEHSEAPCIFITENEAPAISCALPQLLNFDEILFVNETNLKMAETFLQEYPENMEIVIFTANAYTKVNPEEIFATLQLQGYNQNKHIYENEFVSAYILQK